MPASSASRRAQPTPLAPRLPLVGAGRWLAPCQCCSFCAHNTVQQLQGPVITEPSAVGAPAGPKPAPAPKAAPAAAKPAAASKPAVAAKPQQAQQPAAAAAGGEAWVGKSIRVFWADDQQWYEGTVAEFDGTSQKHQVQYEDGDEEWLDLGKEKYEWVEHRAGAVELPPSLQDLWVCPSHACKEV